MIDTILVLNADSSSLKFSLFPAKAPPDARDLICEGECEAVGHRVHFIAHDRTGALLCEQLLPFGTTQAGALAALDNWLIGYYPEQKLLAAGHRVAHGGSNLIAPALIDSAVIAEMRRLTPLAPMHQPHHLATIDDLAKLHRGLPQVACFDTAFHHTVPKIASGFALPRRFAEQGVRRYGFHGISYEYIASVLPEFLGAESGQGRVVVAHLGSSASMCAMRGQRSIATSMGLSDLDGLPMGRRCGSLDPGVVLYLMHEEGMSLGEISHLLYYESGLLGVSGISDDMRILLASDEPPAEEAIRLFVYRISRELGSLTAALGGIDALVFTASIGEHAPKVRQMICDDAAWLGLGLDVHANCVAGPRISPEGRDPSVWVIPANENLMIARHVWELLAA